MIHTIIHHALEQNLVTWREAISNTGDKLGWALGTDYSDPRRKQTCLSYNTKMGLLTVVNICTSTTTVQPLPGESRG